MSDCVFLDDLVYEKLATIIATAKADNKKGTQ
jgi:hypothetical protein